MEIQPRSRATIPHRKRTDCRGEPPLPLGACRKRLWTRGPERAGSRPFFLPRSASSLRSSAPRLRWPSSEHRNRRRLRWADTTIPVRAPPLTLLSRCRSANGADTVSDLARRFEKHVHSGDVHPSIVDGVRALMPAPPTDWAAKGCGGALPPCLSFPDAPHPDHVSIRLHCVHTPPPLPQPLSHCPYDVCFGHWPSGSMRERK